MYLFFLLAGAFIAIAAQRKLFKSDAPAPKTLAGESEAIDDKLISEEQKSDLQKRTEDAAKLDAQEAALNRKGIATERTQNRKAVIPQSTGTGQDDYNKSFREWAAKNMAKNK